MSSPNASKLWCLINARNGNTIRALSLNEARAAIAGVPEESRVDWWVWREGWPDWKPLVQVRLLTEPLYRSMNEEPPAFNVDVSLMERRGSSTFDPRVKHETHTMLEMDSEIEELMIAGAEFVSRTHRRMKRRLKVKIKQGDRKFVSHTVDVSAGGLHLEDLLPDWVAGYCQVVIIKPDSKKAIELTCSVVENQKPEERTRLQIINMNNQELERALEKWLAA